MNNNYKNRLPIIWDSGLGYDLGVTEYSKGVIEDTFEIETLTHEYGPSIIPVSEYQVIPYTKENYDKMVRKYEYEQHHEFFNQYQDLW